MSDDRVIEKLSAVVDALWALNDTIARASRQPTRTELAQEETLRTAGITKAATAVEDDETQARLDWLKAGKSPDALGAPASFARMRAAQKPATSGNTEVRRPADMGPQENTVTRPAKPSTGIGLILGTPPAPAPAPAEDPAVKIAMLEAELAKAKAASNPA